MNICKALLTAELFRSTGRQACVKRKVLDQQRGEIPSRIL